MATDIFARIGNIKGESQDVKHKGEVDVLAWTWGLAQTGSMAYGGGGGAGKVSFQDLTFSHRVDKASPALMLACATGQHLKDATITVRKAGKDQHEYLIVRMPDVLVTGVNSSVDGSDSSEAVALQFAKVNLEYKPQKPDGSLDAGVHFKYDIKAKKEG